MNERKTEIENEWVNEMNEWIKWMHEMNKGMNGQTNERKNDWENESMNEMRCDDMKGNESDILN